jgi:hypothetical protein
MATTFLAWFDRTFAANPGDQAVAALKPFVDERRADLEKQDSLEAIRAVVQQHAQERNLTNLVAAFDTLAGRYAADNVGKTAETAPCATGGESKPRGWFVTVLGYSGVFVVGLITFILLGIILYFLYNDALLRSLADVAVARGLITFFFSIGTIGIAFVMIASLFVSSLEGSVLKQRFDSGKEILTALIAILGTVVGFYFGSQSSDRAAAAIDLQPIAVSDAAPKPEETIQISTLASGGEAPYRYSIAFQWPDGDTELAKELPDITNKDSPSGFISEKISIPRQAAGKSISYVLLVTDAGKHATSVSGEKLVVAGADKVSSNETKP